MKSHWTLEEHRRFLEALQWPAGGANRKRRWEAVARHVKTRTVAQVRYHAKKFFLRKRRPTSERRIRSIHDIDTLEAPELRRVAPKDHAEEADAAEQHLEERLALTLPRLPRRVHEAALAVYYWYLCNGKPEPLKKTMLEVLGWA
ncbi:hypothetical protein CDCA_CDCA09G2610 [Cyanidium caldarium]|uniref:Uncharacterized protein n=1 Tax=Cyanidium caldarium TaxID=2771 RepID=A0AAV9IW94_CYACA|nr:hypothetical protein CDCA_CDCA09G2610 [Cyanidium caldarium]